MTLMMNDEVRRVLFQTAAFLKLLVEEPFSPFRPASTTIATIHRAKTEAAELLDQIGALLAKDAASDYSGEL